MTSLCQSMPEQVFISNNQVILVTQIPILPDRTQRIYPSQPRTSSRKSVLSKPHFRNRSRYESSKLSMQFFKLEPEILICLPLVPKLIKNQSAVIWKLFEFFEFVM